MQIQHWAHDQVPSNPDSNQNLSNSHIGSHQVGEAQGDSRKGVGHVLGKKVYLQISPAIFTEVGSPYPTHGITKKLTH